MLSLRILSPRFSLFTTSPRIFSKFSIPIKSLSISASASVSGESPGPISGRITGDAGVQLDDAGVQLDDTVDSGSGKLRLDTWISSRIGGISRARVQANIRNGHVSVNGHVVEKVSHIVRNGDKVKCAISELQPLKAEPEDIPLDVVYEDDHVLVVNKPAYMVVHPAPGNANGTLVNAILHHCSLAACSFSNHEVPSEVLDLSDDEFGCISVGQTYNELLNSNAVAASVRPGIVHRLDKGTSGLLLVAKDAHSHAHLSEQFKQRTIHRVYISLTCGAPSSSSGRVDIPIGRDVNNRIRMTAVTGPIKSRRARHAASTKSWKC